MLTLGSIETLGNRNHEGNGVKFHPYASSSHSLSTEQLPLGKMKKRTRRINEVILGGMKCEHCGKGYKHISCLTKHRWEHTIYFNPKLSISKHQQVQLLEAASILVQMNQSPELHTLPLDVLFKKHGCLMNDLNESNVDEDLDECIHTHGVEDGSDNVFG